MSNIAKTIEELSVSKNAGDLWDEFEEESNINLKLHYVNDHATILRMLGPFMSAFRFYAPQLKNIPNINIEGIAEHNVQAIEEAKKLLPKPSVSNDALAALESAKRGGMTWQKCVMVNVFQRDIRKIKILTMNRKMKDALVAALHSQSEAPINGLYAHDIGISKRGNGMNTTFQARVVPANHLPITDINAILHQGLIDIPTLINAMNKSKTSHYYYKIASNYKMPAEYMKELLAESTGREEESHLRSTEEHLNDIPISAFERRNNMRGAIGSLEV